MRAPIGFSLICSAVLLVSSAAIADNTPAANAAMTGAIPGINGVPVPRAPAPQVAHSEHVKDVTRSVSQQGHANGSLAKEPEGAFEPNAAAPKKVRRRAAPAVAAPARKANNAKPQPQTTMRHYPLQQTWSGTFVGKPKSGDYPSIDRTTKM